MTLPTKMGSLLSRSTTKYTGLACGESWQRNSKSLRFLPEWERSGHYYRYSIPVNADFLWFWLKRYQSYGCGRGCRSLHPGLVHLDDGLRKKSVENSSAKKLTFLLLWQAKKWRKSVDHSGDQFVAGPRALKLFYFCEHLLQKQPPAARSDGGEICPGKIFFDHLRILVDF